MSSPPPTAQEVPLSAGGSDGVEIHFRQWKLVLFLIATLLFVGAAPVIVVLGIKDGGADLFIAIGMALVDVLFFGGGALWGIDQLRRPKPAILITREGFYDGASAVGTGFIGWDEVLSISNTFSYLAVIPKDCAAVLKRQPTLKRWILSPNSVLVGTPITIPGLALDRSLGEVERLLQQGWQRYLDDITLRL